MRFLGKRSLISRFSFGLTGFLSFWAFEILCPKATFFGRVRTHAKRGTGAVALLFERCPNDMTMAHSEVLLEMNAPATFFLEGQRAELYPRAFRAMRHFEIGIHGWDYRPLVFRSSLKIKRGLRLTVLKALDVSGRPPRFLMPPMGLKDIALLHTASRLGLIVVLPSASIKLKGKGVDPVDRILKRVLPGDTILIPKDTPPGIVRRLIQELRGHGINIWGLRALLY